jgi:hypothetical protein
MRSIRNRPWVIENRLSLCQSVSYGFRLIRPG